MIELAGYTISSEIRRRKRSLLFRGKRNNDDKPVVVKILHSEFPTAHEIARFRQEFDIAKKLELDGVVQAYALEKYGNSLAMVMEDFGGISLKEVLVQHDRSDIKSFLKLALKMADTLAQIHARDIVHKDLKPDNIIVNLGDGLVKIGDFGISSELKTEMESARSAQSLEGTLSYMSPEQTGRMNRSVDYRSDLYSLGVIFYEMLSGELPFASADPMELVHAHIARQPAPLNQRNPDIPQVLSDIVMKLMEKTAENRYQGATGLRADLQECLQQLGNTGSIPPFALGRRDLASELHIPQKLYGRENEIKTLLRRFSKVSAGTTELMLVDGYSGIGKSALVNEIHKPIVERRGYFIAGKFDQFKRNIPYSAPIESFGKLVREILTEDEEKIQVWKEKLLSALGPNGQVIIDVIPEVELIIGKQPPVQELGPAEHQNRFNTVFSNFIKVFAHQDHPLAIFLDDLQWADTPTLNLLKLLITDRDTLYLFFIGAYRDNEVDEHHPAIVTIDEIKRSGAKVSNIHLNPLDKETLLRLIMDTVEEDAETCMPLMELVNQKTNGNPFFVNQFLKNLHHERLMRFDISAGKWKWDVDQIRLMNITDNVVEMLAGKMQRLPDDMRKILRLASAIGSTFDLKTISIVGEMPPLQCAHVVWKAMQEGYVVPLGDGYKLLKAAQEDEEIKDLSVLYKFLHDRVQQAAYSLIKEEDRKAVHARIGERLKANLGPEEIEERIFDIVGHLNYGIDVMKAPRDIDKMVELARLNLEAGMKAKSSSAFTPALRNLKAALELIGKVDSNPWEQYYDIVRPLYREHAECEYLLGNVEFAQKEFRNILQHCKTKLEKAEIYGLLINLGIGRNEFHEVLEMTSEALKMFGIKFDAIPSQVTVLGAVARTEIKLKRKLKGKPISSLIDDLPELNDKELEAVMRICLFCVPAGYLYNPDSMVIAALTIVNLTLDHGQSEYAAFGFAIMGIVWVGVLGQMIGYFLKEGVECGELAMALRLKYKRTHSWGKVPFVMSLMQGSFRKPLSEMIPLTREAYKALRDAGDNLYGSYICMFAISMKVCKGDATAKEIFDEHQRFLSFLRQVKDEGLLLILIMKLRFLLNLQGETEHKLSLDGEAFGEKFSEEYLLKVLKDTNNTTGYNFYYLYKMHQYFMYEEYDKALAMGLEADKTKDANLAQVTNAVIPFLIAMNMAALHENASFFKRLKFRRRIRSVRRQFKTWAANSPRNFEPKYILVQAEEARIRGRDPSELYELAIKKSREYESNLDLPLAGELAAKYHLNRGLVTIAKAYMAEAHYGYNRWGAKQKTADLTRRYPQLAPAATGEPGYKPGLTTSLSDTTRETVGVSSHGTGTTASAGYLDVNTIMKASQAISGEIRLDSLLQQLMHIVIENAGAQKGMLLLEDHGSFLIVADKAADSEKVKVLQRLPATESDQLSLSIVNYVNRTRQDVVLNDASKEGQFTGDPYIARTRARSVLCSPIMRKNKTIGIIYLENNLANGAFTANRVRILNMITSQAAISLENAGLYANLEEKVEERTGELRESKKEIDDIMANVQQGLLIVNRDGTISSEYSSRVAEIFERDDLGEKKFEDMFFNDPEAKPKVSDFLEQMLNNPFMSEKLFARANPLANYFYKMVNTARKEVVKVLDFNFSRIYGTDQEGNRTRDIQKIMVVIDDRTEEFELKRELEQKAQEQAGKVEKLYRILQLPPSVFSGFISESSATLDTVYQNLNKLHVGENSPENPKLLQICYREVHTLKGNARALNLDSIAGTAHELEDVFDELKENPVELTRELKDKVFDAVGSLKNDIQDGNSLFEKILNMQSALQTKPHDAMREFEERLRIIIDREAAELGKSVVFQFRNELSKPLESPVMTKLRNPLSHIMRNSISHGIESDEERARLGKTLEGRITVTLTERDGHLWIVCEDDGSGLKTERIREKAVEQRLITAEKAASMREGEIHKLIFASGFSTAQNVSGIAGRGVGMDAVREDLKALNSVIIVASKPGQYTRFTIKIPLP